MESAYEDAHQYPQLMGVVGLDFSNGRSSQKQCRMCAYLW